MKYLLALVLITSFTFAAIAQQNTVVQDSVYKFTEIPPSFPGEEIALVTFIDRNRKYEVPAKGVKTKMEKVWVRFVIDETGNVTNPVVVKSLTEPLDKEAIRVVSMLPNFNPGTVHSTPVKSYYTLPVVFKVPE